MNDDIQQQLRSHDIKLDAIYMSIEKMRRYFLWTLIITIAVIVLPLVGLFFALPSFLGAYSSLGI